MKALTPEEYAAAAPTRPYTDRPFGQASAGKRSRDAKLSGWVRGYERSRRPVSDSVRVVSPWTGRVYWVKSR